jgi:hypothetical protein
MQPLKEPMKELQKARLAIQGMQNASSLDAYEEAWKEFLRRLERTWYKTNAHLKRSPKFLGWTERQRTDQLRRSDPLLSYLTNARGVDEHSIEDITRQETGGIGINPAHGRELYIEEMSIDRGIISIKSPQALKIEFKPGKVRLLPVRDRKTLYDVPKSHSGIDLKSTDPIEMAELGVDFYQGYIDKAEKFFVK